MDTAVGIHGGTAGMFLGIVDGSVQWEAGIRLIAKVGELAVSEMLA